MKELKEFTVERLSEIAMDAYEADLSNDEMQALAKIALAAKKVRPTFDEWLSSLDGTIEVDCGCVTTEEFYHWIRVAYDATPPINHTEQDGWIKCSERMPEPYAEIVIRTSHGEVIAGETDAAGFLDLHDGTSMKMSGATHWMLLPAAPKPEM